MSTEANKFCRTITRVLKRTFVFGLSELDNPLEPDWKVRLMIPGMELRLAKPVLPLFPKVFFGAVVASNTVA